MPQKTGASAATVAAASHQRVGFLALIPAQLRQFGADPATVLVRAGLAANALDDPNGLIAYTAMGAVLQAAVAATQCPHFGLLIGQRVTPETLGVVGSLMRTAPTLRHALIDLVTHQHRHARGAAIYLLERDSALFGYAVYQAGTRALDQVLDGAAAAAFTIVRARLTLEDGRGLRVCIARASPAELAPYRAAFATLPRFDAAFTGVEIPSAWLDRRLDTHAAGPREMLTAQLQAYQPVGDYDIVTQVRAATRLGLMTGQASGEAIAARLGMTRRTLHRRLAGRDTGLQRLLGETRFEVATQLLGETNLSVQHVAAILGFAEASALTHAFTRWSGISPSDWRRRLRVGGGDAYAALMEQDQSHPAPAPAPGRR